jgi:membrane peptidoglycan carboxypeptidase
VIQLSRGFAARVIALVRTGLIVGVVVAALVYPLAAVAGLGIKAGAEQLDGQAESLPDALPAQTTRLYAADGTTMLAQFYDEHRIYAPISTISAFVKQAIVAAEDARFYDHHGVDMKGIARAFVANHRSGQVAQGASTLTMQYVRNVLRDSASTPEEVEAATEQTGARKLREIRLAVAVEQRMSKTDILERYLNVAYFGHRAYGITAASEVYFSKEPADLNLAEAATLAGLVQAPSTYDPAGDQTAATDRRNYVIDRMIDLGYITQEAAGQAKARPITPHLSEPPNDCVSTGQNSWGFFCDLFKSWWMGQPAFGSSPQERLERLRRGGYKIVTSLDAGLQDSAERNVVAKEKVTSAFAHGLVAIEPGTGRVKAMAVNRVYSLDQASNGAQTDRLRRGAKILGSYPNTVNPLLGGGDLPGFQAGSTFKMFTMLAALEADLPLNTAYDAPTRLVTRWPVSGSASCGGYWCPANANPSWMDGRRTMWTAFGRSVNTYFVNLEQRIGADAAVAMAQRLGIRFRAESDAELAEKGAHGWGPFTLGVSATTPLDLANAYATLAAEGRYCAPLPVSSIKDSAGRPVAAAKPACKRVLRSDVARAATDAARCPVGDQSTFRACDGGTAPEVHKMMEGRPVAGKTGSSDSYASETVVIYTPQLAVAAIAANPDDPRDAVGSKVQVEVVKAVASTLASALRDEPLRDFTPPSSAIAYGFG